MTIVALLGHAWRRNRVALLFMAGGLMLFEWLVTRLAPDAAQNGAIRQLISLLPPSMMEMFGNEIAQNLNPRGAVGFGYGHPFAIVLPAAWVIRVAAGSLAGEISAGTMDLIASRAVPRWATVAAATLAMLGGLAIISVGGWLGTAVGIAGRPSLGLDAMPFLRVSAMQWLLFAAFGSVALLISAARRPGASAIGIASAIVAVSFAVDYVARVWKPIGWLRPAALFMYFHPQALSATGVVGSDVAVLAGVTLVATLVAFIVFEKRDL